MQSTILNSLNFDKKINQTQSESSSNKLFLAVSGNIGTGKTTLTKMLAKKYGFQPHFEVVDTNPYLADFYADMKRWSFAIQIFFLNSRFKAHQYINQSSNSAIQDRTIYEDAHIFARNLYETGHLEKRDYFTYLDLYHEMCKHLNPPDLMIYIKKSLPSLKKNILKRSVEREYEKNIPDEYLANLNRYYDEFAKNYNYGKIIIIESDELDFVSNHEHFELIGKKIFEELDQKEMFLPGF
jgi:deoxyadenosine/deoxycytidine kinase